MQHTTSRSITVPLRGLIGVSCHPTRGGVHYKQIVVCVRQWRRDTMLPRYKKDAALRLKVAAGHLEAVRRMVENDAYCVDLMKQLSAVQATLEGVQQIFLRNHLSTCVSDAIQHGMGDEIIDELMEALKYNKS